MTSPDSRQRRRRWPRRLLITVAVAFAVYVAFGFLGVPLIVRHAVIPRISSDLNGTAALTRVSFNPFTFVIRLDDLVVADEAGEAVLGFEHFEGDFELLATVFRSGYHFGSAMLVGPSLRGEIDADGTINLLTLAAPMLEQKRDEPSGVLPRLVVGTLDVSGGRVEFSDESPIEPFAVSIEGLQFAVDDLDTFRDHDNLHRLTASTASGARFDWEGVLRLDPLTSTGTVRIADLPLPQGTPYVHTLTEGRIRSGRLAVELDYQFVPAAEPPVALVRIGEARIDELSVTRSEEPILDVAELVLSDARIDAGKREINVASMATTGTRSVMRREPSGRLAISSLVRTDRGDDAEADVAVRPTRSTPIDATADRGPISIAIDATRRLLEETQMPWTMRIDRIAIDDYAADVTDLTRQPPVELALATDQVVANRLKMTTGTRTIAIDDVSVVAPDIRASMPLLPVEAEAPDSEEVVAAPSDEADAAAADPYVVTIGAVRVEAGTVVVRDESIDPPAGIDLAELQLEMTGISTGGGAVPFTLASSLQGSGRMEVSGNLDAFQTPPAASVDVRLSGVPLKPFDPLAGPYVGHGIDSGRMAVTFPVTLAENRVEGDLQFAFDGLKLGKKVKSPHAPDAPIKLGLDLLRDSNDHIEGTLPIEGDITDPNFSMSGLVLDAFFGLMGNIALAPFNLLGSLFGGDDDADISRVEFEPGTTVLSGEALASLDVIARALLERPALTLEATGHYNTELDEPVVRETLLEKRILAGIQERTKLIETINAEAYASWVRRFYSAEIGAVDESKTVEQMAAALRAALVVTDEEKAALARERAEAAIDVLVRENGVPENRVRITVARSDAVLADSPLVEFALK